jgi:hypothetical protein
LCQVKNWSRLYAPSAILGVYTYDELLDSPIKDINAAPPRPRNGAEYGRQAQEQQQGRVIDSGQEEQRAGLINALEAFAAKGTAPFLTQWKKTAREERVLIGEPEYLRILAKAEEADLNQNPAVDADFVDQMNKTEADQ